MSRAILIYYPRLVTVARHASRQPQRRRWQHRLRPARLKARRRPDRP